METGQIVGSFAGQTVACLGHSVCRTGQMVVSAGPLAHCVGLAAIAHEVGEHSVMLPGLMVGLQSGSEAGHNVGSCGQAVCTCGHSVGTPTGQVVVFTGQTVG